MTRFKRAFFFISVLMCFAGGVARAARSSNEISILNRIQQERGYIVPVDKAPTLYRYLNQVFTRLSQAQNNVIGGQITTVSEVFIVESPIPNAFVKTTKETGVRVAKNLVFITTGLIRKMADVSDGIPRDFKADRLRNADPATVMTYVIALLAGTGGHEMGHPLETLDTEGIHERSDGSSQAIEMRADIEGARILREAGFSPAFLYYALEKLFSGDNPKGTVAAGLRSHPQNQLRLAILRLFLAFDQTKKGLMPDTPPVVVSPADAGAMGKEIQFTLSTENLWKFQVPASLAEAADRMARINDISKSLEFKELEFNRLLLFIDHTLMERGASGGGLSPDERDVIDKVYKAMQNRDFPWFRIYKISDIRSLHLRNSDLGFQNDAQTLSHTHEWFLEHVAAYPDKDIAAWIDTDIGDLVDQADRLSSFTSQGLNFLRLSDIFLPAKAFTSITPRLLTALTHKSMGTSEEEHLHSLFAGLSPQKKLTLMTYGSSLVAKTKESFSGYTPSLDGFPARMRTDDRYKKVREELISYISQLKIKARHGDKEAAGLLDPFMAEMRKIWDNRGFYGVYEFFVIHQFHYIDWDFILECLGIPRDQGYSQIRSEVKAVLSGRKPKGDMNIFAARLVDRAARESLSAPGKPAWWDNTLYPYFAGKKLKDNENFRETAPEVFGRIYLVSNPKVFETYYGRLLARAIANFKPDPSLGVPTQVEKIHEKICRELGMDSDLSVSLQGRALLIHARAVEKSSLSEDVKKEWLTHLFIEVKLDKSNEETLNNYRAGNVWLSNEDTAPEIASILRAHGLLPSVVDLFFKLKRNDPKNIMEYQSGSVRRIFFTQIIGEIDQFPTDDANLTATKEHLLRYARFTSSKYPPGAPELKLTEALFKKAGTLKPDPKFDLKLFIRLTRGGGTQFSDHFFQRRIYPILRGEPGLRKLGRWLEKGRVRDYQLRFQMARHVLNPQVRLLLSKMPEKDLKEILELVQKFDRYAPTGLTSKDKYLESLAWKFGLRDKELNGAIEDYKSSNWRRLSPLLVNLGSSANEAINGLSENGRYQLISFLMDPSKNGGGLPKELEQTLEGSLFRVLKQTDEADARASGNSPKSDPELKQNAKLDAIAVKNNIEELIKNTTPMERIPLIEAVMTSGENGLQKNARFPLNIIRDLLKFKENSDEEKFLRAYLDVVPDRMKTVALSYILSQGSHNKRDINSIFEMFNVVGKKFGQSSSLWNLFGDAISRQNAKLKTDAEPMTLAEAEDVLLPEERRQIKRFIKVMGSASAKTTILVETADGNLGVLMVQSPHIQDQIRSDLELGQRYYERLKFYNVSSENAALISLVFGNFKRHLGDEVKMNLEAQKLAEVRKIVQEINKSADKDFDGFHFDVPVASAKFTPRENAALFTVAQGKPYEHLTSAQKARVRKAIAKMSLRMLFQFGKFDADRHGGNWMVDFKTGTITFIDAGQLTDFEPTGPWTWDARLTLAGFIEAYDENNVDKIVENALKMADAAETKSVDTAAIKTQLKTLLAPASTGSGRHTDQDRLRKMVAIFTQNGLILDDKFSFGALKGFMTLLGEHYVSAQDFKKLLREEIKTLYLKKIPALLVSRARPASKPVASTPRRVSKNCRDSLSGI